MGATKLDLNPTVVYPVHVVEQETTTFLRQLKIIPTSPETSSWSVPVYSQASASASWPGRPAWKEAGKRKVKSAWQGSPENLTVRSYSQASWRGEVGAGSAGSDRGEGWKGEKVETCGMCRSLGKDGGHAYQTCPVSQAERKGPWCGWCGVRGLENSHAYDTCVKRLKEQGKQ